MIWKHPARRHAGELDSAYGAVDARDDEPRLADPLLRYAQEDERIGCPGDRRDSPCHRGARHSRPRLLVDHIHLGRSGAAGFDERDHVVAAPQKRPSEARKANHVPTTV